VMAGGGSATLAGGFTFVSPPTPPPPNPPAPFGPLQVQLANLPARIVVGQPVQFNVDVTAGPRSDQRATIGVNGTAHVMFNGAVACTAAVSNGSGSCSAPIPNVHSLTLTVSFAGLGASALSVPTSVFVDPGTVTITGVTAKIKRCQSSVTVRGTRKAPGGTITVQRKAGKRWVKAATIRTKKSKWKVSFTAPKARTITVRASDGKSTTTSVVTKVTGRC
ncbi:MAG: hypothetical protein WCP28_16805, partial [Actinomycetes bacterium]